MTIARAPSRMHSLRSSASSHAGVASLFAFRLVAGTTSGVRTAATAHDDEAAGAATADDAPRRSEGEVAVPLLAARVGTLRVMVCVCGRLLARCVKCAERLADGWIRVFVCLIGCGGLALLFLSETVASLRTKRDSAAG